MICFWFSCKENLVSLFLLKLSLSVLLNVVLILLLKNEWFILVICFNKLLIVVNLFLFKLFLIVKLILLYFVYCKDWLKLNDVDFEVVDELFFVFVGVL